MGYKPTNQCRSQMWHLLKILHSLKIFTVKIKARKVTPYIFMFGISSNVPANILFFSVKYAYFNNIYSINEQNVEADHL